MVSKKKSYKNYIFNWSILPTIFLPFFVIYLVIDKPDYKIINKISAFNMNIATNIGNILNYPIKSISKLFSNIKDFNSIKEENLKLKEQISELISEKNKCDILVLENQKLNKELDIIKSKPIKSTLASIIYNKSLFGDIFFINKGSDSGIKKGMVVISLDGNLVGVISDTNKNFSKIRSLNDTKSNIAVKIAGSEVYGFIQGKSSENPSIDFFSDPNFEITKGLKLTTSNINGVLPEGINIGEILENKQVKITSIKTISNVIVLHFDNEIKYK